MSATTTVWSYGGGTQSAAIAALVVSCKLPRPDVVVMADTGYEVSETWDYLRDVIAPALAEINLSVEIVTQEEYARHGLTLSDHVLLPAFTRQSGAIGKLPTYCSNEWKQRPIRRWLRANNYNDCDVWLGISMDEIERMKPSGLNWYRHVYPLIEMRPTYRRECYEIIDQMGWPPPPKSRCYMCPNMSPENWKQLKTKYPDDFSKALQMETRIQEVDPLMFLHSLAIPLHLAVEQTELQQSLFASDFCDSGYCFV